MSGAWCTLVLLVATSSSASSTATVSASAFSSSLPQAPRQTRSQPMGLVGGLPPEPWARGLPRYFLATAVDFGFLYLRPRLSLGYGLPHQEWLGLDVNPIASQNGLGAYGGVRVSAPHLDIRAGARFFLPFQRSFLTPRDSYGRLELEDRTGPSAKYVTLEVEATADLPLGPGEVLAVLSGSLVEGVPEGYWVFEETIRVVLAPPFVWRARFGYTFALGPGGAVRFTPVVEYVRMPGRQEEVWRGGLVTRVRLSEALEVNATFVPVIGSPDRIGINGADFAQLGVRWRWATGP